MSVYTVKDNLSGKNITFEWTGEGEPTEQDMSAIVAAGTEQKEKVIQSKAKMYFNLYGRPMMEFGGMTAGAAVGGAAGVPAGPGAVATGLAGAGLGYGIGKKGADIIENALAKMEGEKPQEKGVGEELLGSGKDILEGATVQAAGGVAGQAISGAAKLAGAAIKPVWARLMGTGKIAIEEAIKSGEAAGLTLHPLKTVTQFDKALRGKLTGEDIVENAKSALSVIKERRGSEYVTALEKVKANPTQLDAVKKNLDNTLETLSSSERFQIQQMYNPKGELEFDFSKSTLVEGQPVLKRAMEDVIGWTDNTPKGLDILKKRLSTYIDQVKDGTPAEVFLTTLEKTLDAGIKKAVPGYAEMTKGYAEASKLIRDIETGLMLRKSGMSGRITADQTLRRLSSVMKDNFELRSDLVRALGNQGSQDLMGQIAGREMSKAVPHGLAGVGTALTANAALVYINPSFWPVLAASSPKISGEFLRLFGKAAASMEGSAKAIGTIGAYEAAQ